MATAAQVQKFVDEWLPSATDSSAQLGVPVAYILGQWGMETAWGTQPNMGKNNPGNVGNLGNGKWQDYSSKDSFVKTYVASMRNDFPALKNGSYSSTTLDPAKDVPAIFGGDQKYAQLPGGKTDPNYWKSVMGGVQALLSNTGASIQQIQANGWKVNPDADAIQTPPDIQIQDAVTGALSSVSDYLQYGALVVAGLVFMIVGVFLLAKDAIPTPAKIAKEVTGND